MVLSLRFLLLLLILINISPVSAQSNVKEQIIKLQSVQNQTVKISGLIELLGQLDTVKYPKVLGVIYHELGSIYLKSDEFNKSEKYFNAAIDIRKNLKERDFLELNESRYGLSVLYKKNERSKEQYTVLLEIIKDNQKDDNTCNAYMDIASNLVKRGDAYSALNYLNIALADKAFTMNVSNEVRIHCKIIFVYAIKNNNSFKADVDSIDLEVVKKHLAAVEENFVDSKLPRVELIKAYYNACLTFDMYGLLDLSLEKYTKTMEYYRAQNDTYNELEALTNIGIVYARLDKHTISEAYFYRIINESDEIEQIATAYNNLAYYLHTDSSLDRIPLAQQSINILLQRRAEVSDAFSLPSLELILSSGSELDVLIYLIDLLGHYVNSYKETKDKQYLFKAKEDLYLIDQLVSLIKSNSLNEHSKLFWTNQGVDTYMLGAEICYLLYDIEEAFYYLEKNKALILQENIKSFQDKLMLDIPGSLLEKEYRLRYKIFGSQQSINNNLGNVDQEDFKVLVENHDRLVDSLVIAFPDYMKTIEEVQISTLDFAIGEYVSEESSFVEYILGNEKGYGIFSTIDGPTIFEIEDVAVLQDELERFRYFLSEPILAKDEIQKFRTIGKTLFKKLFPFDNALELLKNKKLTIVPDQNLQNIPFEAFAVLDHSSLSDSYLINQCEISYLQSVSLFQQIDKKENEASQKILGVAPYRYDDTDMNSLEESKTFMTTLSKFASSKMLLEEAASKSNFLNEVNDFQLIHISTHGGVDAETQQPWIAFRDNKLTLNELLGVENNAELVVLDACKTNEGELISGEGIINLSRGFFYNGTKSVLSALWNVNDRSGSQIMKNFYDGLCESKSKSKALQLAKVDYLSSSKGVNILPYYWAVYTLTGNTDAVELNYQITEKPYFSLILLCLGMLSLFFLWWIFIRNRA